MPSNAAWTARPRNSPPAAGSTHPDLSTSHTGMSAFADVRGPPAPRSWSQEVVPMTNDGRGVGMWGNLPPEQDPGLGVALTPPPRPDVPQSPQHDPWPWEASHAERRAPRRPDGAHRASTIGLEERLGGAWLPRLR